MRPLNELRDAAHRLVYTIRGMVEGQLHDWDRPTGLDSADASAYPKCKHVCLHGLWDGDETYLRSGGALMKFAAPSITVLGSAAVDLAIVGDAAELERRLAGVDDDLSGLADVADGSAPDSDYREPAGTVLATIRLGSEVGDVVVAGPKGDRLYVAAVDAVSSTVRTSSSAPSRLLATRNAWLPMPMGRACWSRTARARWWSSTPSTTRSRHIAVPQHRRGGQPGRHLHLHWAQHDRRWRLNLGVKRGRYNDFGPPGRRADHGLVVSPDGSRIYVSHYDTDSISVVDPASRNVTPVALPDSPLDVTVAPDGSHLYVTNRNWLAGIDAATNAVEMVAFGTLPRRLQLSFDGNRAYVANFGDHTVAVIDTLTNAVATTFTAGGHPEAMAISPNDQRLYVTDYWARRVTVISIQRSCPTTTSTKDKGRPRETRVGKGRGCPRPEISGDDLRLPHLSPRNRDSAGRSH